MSTLGRCLFKAQSSWQDDLHVKYEAYDCCYYMCTHIHIYNASESGYKSLKNLLVCPARVESSRVCCPCRLNDGVQAAQASPGLVLRTLEVPTCTLRTLQPAGVACTWW